MKRLLIAIVFLFTACIPQPALTSTAITQETATVAPAVTAPITTPTAIALVTPTTAATTTSAVLKAKCPTSHGPAEFILTAPRINELKSDVTAFLNEGGTPDDLMGALKQQGVIGDIRETDLSGDGVPEIVLAAIFEQVRDGGVLVAECINDSYSAHIIDTTPFFSALDIIDVNDVTGDGKPDVTVTLRWGATQTCHLAILVVGWHQTQPINYFNNLIDIDCFAEVSLHKGHSSSSKEIIVTGTTLSYIGDPPGRKVKHIYTFKETRFVLDSTQDLP